MRKDGGDITEVSHEGIGLPREKPHYLDFSKIQGV